MKPTPPNLKYTKDHEWARIDDRMATVGVTDHAQESLGEVVFLELPKVGRELKKGETLGVVESIKAVSDIYSPVAGRVVEVNAALVDNTGAINSDPYASWFVKIEMTESSTPEDLMNAGDYDALVRS